MEEAYGIRTHYYLAENSGGAVIGILPAARVPRPLGRGQLCSLPYCDVGGPLASESPVREALLLRLHGENIGDHEVRDTAAVDTSTHESSPEHLVEGQKVRLLLNLPPSAQELFEGFKSKLRSQINKARKNGLSVRLGRSSKDVEAFYAVFSRNMRDLGSPTHSQRWFERLVVNYDKHCNIGLVELDGVIVGGGLILRNHTTMAVPWASTLRRYNHLAPNMLLYWALLESSISEGCTRFDFGRSTFGEGTYRFKAQWGAKPVSLQWQTLESAESNGKRLRWREEPVPVDSGFARSSLEYIWRHLPVAVTTPLGSRLRPYVSL